MIWFLTDLYWPVWMQIVENERTKLEVEPKALNWLYAGARAYGKEWIQTRWS